MEREYPAPGLSGLKNKLLSWRNQTDGADNWQTDTRTDRKTNKERQERRRKRKREGRKETAKDS